MPITNYLIDDIRIRSQDIDNYISRDRYEIWDSERLRKIEYYQSKVENSLPLYNSACPLSRNSEPLHSLIFLSEALDQKTTNINFLHPEFAHTYQRLQFNSCLFNSLIDKEDHNKFLTVSGKIQEYLGNFKLLKYGSQSASPKNYSDSYYSRNFVFTADLGNLKNLVVIKTSFKTTRFILLHEVIVGIYGTNLLRQKIPNYSFVYGGFSCLPVLVDVDEKNYKKSEFIDFCHQHASSKPGEDNNVNYILYENVKGVSFDKYVKTCTGPQFVNAMLQIIFALYYGEKTIEFTHYDLHNQNVIIRDISPAFYKDQFQIVYQSVNDLIYLNCTNVATIIDYEHSHFSLSMKGEKYNLGANNYTKYSILPDRPWIFHDIYKLLVTSYFTAQNIQNPNIPVINECARILSLLTTDNISEIDYYLQVNKVDFSKVFFPYNLRTKNKKSSDFIIEIINLYPEYIKSRDPSLVLLNGQNEKFEIENLKDYIPKNTLSIVAFYQMLNFHQVQEQRIEIMQKYLDANFIQYNSKYLSEYNKYLIFHIREILLIPLLKLSNAEINRSLLFSNFFADFKSLSQKLVLFYKNYHRYISLIDIFDELLTLMLFNINYLKIRNKEEFVKQVKKEQYFLERELLSIRKYVDQMKIILQKMKEIYIVIDNYFSLSVKAEYSQTPAAWYWNESKVIQRYLFN